MVFVLSEFWLVKVLEWRCTESDRLGSAVVVNSPSRVVFVVLGKWMELHVHVSISCRYPCKLPVHTL